MPIDKCKKCGIDIQEFLTGRKNKDGDIYCKRCFYDEFGKVIENNPIATPARVLPSPANVG